MTLTAKILQHIQNREGDFNTLALEVFAYQYEHCLPYQGYCQKLGKTPDKISHWKQVPAVSTEVFREFEICTLPVSKARYVFETSGTTQGKKGRHYIHDLTLYDAAIQNSFMAGLGLPEKPSTLFRILTPSFNEVSTASLYYMFQKTVESHGAPGSRFYFKNGDLDYQQLTADLGEDAKNKRAVVLLGTAFSWVNFFDYLQEKNLSFQLPPGSRLLETGGLKGKTRSVSRPELYELFSSRLGLELSHCYSEYGMTELTSQCHSLPNTHVFYSPPWMPIQIIHPESGEEVDLGETGLVQFFDLANLTAVSAVLTSDLARKHPQGFELLGRAPQAVLRGCSTVFEKC